MKTIGLLGGMSWESTLTYYKLLNEGVKNSLGGFHSAKIVLYSVDFDQIEVLQRNGKWEEAGTILGKCAKSLELAGADFILICTNTMHKVIDYIQKDIQIPIIHIAQATAKALHVNNCKKTILLGTRFSMQEDFIKKILYSHDIQVITPNQEQIQAIDSIIFNELVLGVVKPESKKIYQNIIQDLCEKDKTIDSVVLGCTEIGLLIKQNDTNLKIFDTTLLHVKEALKIALS